MASFNVAGLDELIRQIEKLPKLLDDAAPEMLAAGCEVLIDYQKGSVIEKGLIDTGAMFDSIKAGPMKTKNGGYYQEVWPQGRDGKGARNAEKGFVLEYGRSNMPDTHWMSEANRAAEDEVAEAMSEVWNGYVERND